MDIDLLNQELEVSEKPGMDTFDPRFTDIAGMVQDGQFLEAATEAEGVIAEGTYDIRIIGYFLYGVFLEQGVGVLSSVFQALNGLLTDNWEAVGPVKNREKQTVNSLKWFVNQLVKKLDYEENRKEETWNTWLAEVESEQAGEALEELEKLQRNLGMTLEDAAGDVLEGLMKVKSWLSSFQMLVYKEPEEEEEEEEEEEVEAEEAEPVPAAGAAPGPAGALGFSVSGDMAAQGSYHLQVLMNKLAAFERLVQSQKFALAALVADDINEIVANFDPKVYFPGIFGRFSLLFARHIRELISFEQNKGSVEWMALQELYKVDLESFVGFDGELEFSGAGGGMGGEYGGQGEEYPQEDESGGGYPEEDYGGDDFE